MVKRKTIALIGTLDTKGEEIEYLKDQIERRGLDTIIIDVGILGRPLIEADIDREKVAEAGGVQLAELVQRAKNGAEKEPTIEAMTKGVTEVVLDLQKTSEIDGVIAIGGAIGTSVGTAVLKALPYGFPKLMISIVLSSRLQQFVDQKDIAFLNYPTDILGLNFLTRKVLSNASAALVGMATNEDIPQKRKNLVAFTSLGVTTPAVLKAKTMIEDLGYEAIVYTIGTEGLDELLGKGFIDGVLDLTPYEMVKIHITKTSDNLDRLSTAFEAGIPQVIAPGGLDFIILPLSIHKVPRKYKKRKLYKHSPHVTLVRLDKQEAILLGRKMAERANASKGPITIAIPLRGFSAIDKKGQPFFDQKVDNSFINSLKKSLLPHVKVLQIDAHINDEAFVTEVVKTFSRMITKR